MILARGDRLTPDLLRGARLRGQDETTTISLRREMTAGSGSPAERMALIEKRRDELEEFERSIVTEALGAANGNKTKAAEALGISRFALGRRLKGLRL
jgi:DNA-binding NtrC family response regulator